MPRLKRTKSDRHRTAAKKCLPLVGQAIVLFYSLTLDLYHFILDSFDSVIEILELIIRVISDLTKTIFAILKLACIILRFLSGTLKLLKPKGIFVTGLVAMTIVCYVSQEPIIWTILGIVAVDSFLMVQLMWLATGVGSLLNFALYLRRKLNRSKLKLTKLSK